MGLWSKLFRWRRDAPPHATPSAQQAAGGEAAATVELPGEPFVFECQACGKVFEARRKHPSCPECDSRDVSLLTE